MNRSRLLALTRTSLAGSALAMTATCAQAQYRTSIQGSVTDPEGAAIPNATLTLKNAATNETVVRTSNGDGVFNFNALPAATFSLTVSSPGFKTNVLPTLNLIPEQPNSVNVKLEIGETSTTVQVNADTESAVDTQTSNIGATVSSNEIQHLPSFNRDVFTLTQLAPGAIADGSQGSGGGNYQNPGNQGPGGSGAAGTPSTENGPSANANGGNYNTNGISIDGISTVSAVWGGTTVITPSEDSIDNVRIVTNDYDAENGRFSGAQTMVTSKSGTNQLHGSAFFALHRPGLNAYQRSTGTGTPQRDTQRFNQYGASIGGPIWKDKVFAFFAYEATPNNSTDTAQGWYETAAFRAASPANSISSTFNNFPGSAVVGTIVTNNETCATAGLVEGKNCNTIPGQGLDIGSPLTNGLGKQDPTATGTTQNPGVGNGLDGVADIANYLTSSPFSSYYRQFNGRMDANVTGKDHVSFAIYWVPSGFTEDNGGARAYNVFNHAQINDAMSVIWNHTFSPTFLNEARANAAGWRWNEIASNPQAPVGLPEDSTAQIGAITLNQFGSALGSILNQWTYGYKDVATKILGGHTIKFGGDYTSLHYLNDPVGRPNYSFYNVWDYLNDAPYLEQGNFNSLTGQPGGVRTDDRQNLFGGFVQDDWKALSNLTLHAGLRYSYFGSLYTKQNTLSTVSLGTGAGLMTDASVKVGGNLWNPQKMNFGPQVGFNYSPKTFHENLVIRGGYGLNFNQEEIALTANAGANPPTQSFNTFTFASPTDPGANGQDIVYGVSSSINSLAGFAANPAAITTYNNVNLPTAGNASLFIFGNGHGNVPTAYAQHYSLDAEYQFGTQLVASAGYQGSVSRHLVTQAPPNAIATVEGAPLNPLIPNGGGSVYANNGSANNNALLLELKRPMKHGLQLDAQFMWAKSMDVNGSGPYYEDAYFPENPGYSYGRSDFNVGKSFKLYGLWQPVLFHGAHGWAEKVAGDWTLTGIFNIHTGFPFTPSYSIGESLYCSGCGYTSLRPQYLGGGGTDHSNKAFTQATAYSGILNNEQSATATVNGTTGTTVAYSNTFFNVPDFTNAITNATGTAQNVALPGAPGISRNSFTGPGYRDVDASLTKGFGLPNTRLLGENAKFEIRADVFNLFNLLNLNPGSVVNSITASNFGQDTAAQGARTISFQGRFSF